MRDRRPPAAPQDDGWPHSSRWARLSTVLAARPGAHAPAAAEPRPSPAGLDVAQRRRELAVAILAVRRAIRSVTNGAGDRAGSGTPASADGIRHCTRNLLRALGAVDLVISAGTRSVNLSTVRTITACSFSDALAIAEQCREGQPVILDLAGIPDGETRRVADFIAGLLFAVRGRLERLGQRLLLLLPDTAAAGEPPPVADIDLVFAVDDVHDLASALTHALDGAGSPDRGVPGLSRLAAALRPDVIPLDVSDLDLRGVRLSSDDLPGAIWTACTTWPDDDFAARIGEISTQVRPGVFRVVSQTAALLSGG